MIEYVGRIMPSSLHPPNRYPAHTLPSFHVEPVATVAQSTLAQGLAFFSSSISSLRAGSFSLALLCGLRGLGASACRPSKPAHDPVLECSSLSIPSACMWRTIRFRSSAYSDAFTWHVASVLEGEPGQVAIACMTLARTSLGGDST